jgi:hypothetical protein
LPAKKRWTIQLRQRWDGPTAEKEHAPMVAHPDYSTLQEELSLEHLAS